MAPSSSLSTVPGILNEAQRSSASHKKLVAPLLSLYAKDAAATLASLVGCLKHVLLVEKVRAQTRRGARCRAAGEPLPARFGFEQQGHTL